ncbi:MAG: ribosome maturation factor RimP [Lachnospiraceae bacterium]|nr:ribosome maturation factor RimP [Lachnospiraceae bacterium]
MSKRDNYEMRTEELILPILEEMSFELVDVEYVKEGSSYYLRAFIDKPGGITVNDCEAVARRMNELLDAEDFIDESYIFEVSSPGLGRVLKKDKHFKQCIGEKVEIHTYRPIEHTKDFEGILKAFDDKTITIDEENNERVFDRADVALVRLAIDF